MIFPLNWLRQESNFVRRNFDSVFRDSCNFGTNRSIYGNIDIFAVTLYFLVKNMA